MKLQAKKAFTLVELIVVITIIAILGTIAFISFQGYSSSARDSVRISDIKNIRSILELFELKAGKYPDPENNFPITYLGKEVRIQGTFGEQNLTNIGKLNKLPKDPLFGIEYTYSLLNTKKEFELGSILENQFEYTNAFSKTTAATSAKVFNYIKGQYNGKLARVIIGNQLHVLAVPSIINGQIGLKDIEDLISEGLMSHNANSIIPGSYSGIIDNDGNSLILVNTGTLVVFSGTLEDLNNPLNSTKRLELLKGVQNAYSGTIVANTDGIDEILALGTIDTANPTELQTNLASITANIIPGVNVKPVTVGGGINVTYECDNLFGSTLDGGTEYGNFELCNNTIVLDSINSIPLSSNLTFNPGERDVYAVILEEGKNYKFETGGDDYNSDTDMYLYDNSGNLLIRNDNIDDNIFRSQFSFEATYTGYYFIGIMGAYDQGTYDNYTLNIIIPAACASQPSYLNTTFIEGLNSELGKNRQNTDSSSSCYYECNSYYTGNDCTELSYCSNMTITNVTNLNNAFGYSYTKEERCALKNLDFWNSGLTSLPIEIGFLVKLTSLGISENSIISIPSEIGNLTNLTNLDISNNNISSIPSEIGNLTNLTNLNVNNNNISSIPSELGNLIKLEFLSIGYNNISSIPPEIGNLINLDTLNLHFNNISSLPTEIGNLINLKTLFSPSNNISALPSSIGNLSNLEILDLNTNGFLIFPSEIGNLTKLKNLNIGYNNISTLPSEIGNLIILEYLNIGSNNISTLPQEIGNLVNLKTLGLRENELSELPSSIGNLVNLDFLDITNNLLTSLPSSIGNLSKLDKFFLFGNSLGAISLQFYSNDTSIKTQSNITPDGKTISIQGNIYTIEINVY